MAKDIENAEVFSALFTTVFNCKVCSGCQAVVRAGLLHKERAAGSQGHRQDSAFTDGVQFSIPKQGWTGDTAKFW